MTAKVKRRTNSPCRDFAVGFYAHVLFPRLCDYFLNRPSVAAQRRQLLADAHGDVLEIGFGTGLNLPHYPERVRELTVVDPNVGMHRLAQRRIKKVGIAIDYRVVSGERLPLADSSFDCVVSTFTLCSIADVDRALAEVYRVLKPGGQFLFLEHGLSPEPRVQKWQHRLNWLQMRLGDGCRLDRNIKELVSAQPFAAVAVTEFYLDETPRTHGYMYRGMATK
jgi:ubiquinone/menaquinone biosynthesis C-methylase UbiE